MGHIGYLMGHGSHIRWVSGSWVNSNDPLPALVQPQRSRGDRNAPWLEQPDLHVQSNVNSDGRYSRRLVGTWSTGRRERRRLQSVQNAATRGTHHHNRSTGIGCPSDVGWRSTSPHWCSRHWTAWHLHIADDCKLVGDDTRRVRSSLWSMWYHVCGAKDRNAAGTDHSQSPVHESGTLCRRRCDP